jgi:hypothetical protein
MALGPAVFDRNVFALDKTCFPETVMEAAQPIADRLNEPDCRHRWLLRERGERPRRCAAGKRDDLAPS